VTRTGYPESCPQPVSQHWSRTWICETDCDSGRRGDPSSHLVGLARVSTDGQDVQLERDALTEAGCGRIFEEKVSTRSTDRPGLAAALDYLRPGDTLCVWKLDRLGRSVKDVLTIAGVCTSAASACGSSPAPWPAATTPPAKANSSSP
jgi:hypothetical protein